MAGLSPNCDRHRWFIMLVVVVTFGMTAALNAADSTETEPNSTPRTEAAGGKTAAATLLRRVAVIGASATSGFGVTIDVAGPFGASTAPADLARVLQAVMPKETEVSQHGNLFFFNSPMTIGSQMVTQSLKEEPTLIVAIDYLFWFGYGNRNVRGLRITDESDRLELLEFGLTQLERFDCPVLVGDFPDMSAAVGMMLSASQLPAPQTIEKLNARLHDWAAKRPSVIIVPLSDVNESMINGNEVHIGDAHWSTDDIAEAMQRDKLHPTVQGLVLMAQQVVQELIEADLGISTEPFELDRTKVLENLRANIKQHAEPK